MTYSFEEPTQAPRGANISNIEARARIIANHRLTRFFVPEFDNNVVDHRQVISQSKPKPIGPYTSPVTEGLLNLVKEESSRNGGR